MRWCPSEDRCSTPGWTDSVFACLVPQQSMWTVCVMADIQLPLFSENWKNRNKPWKRETLAEISFFVSSELIVMTSMLTHPRNFIEMHRESRFQKPSRLRSRTSKVWILGLCQFRVFVGSCLCSGIAKTFQQVPFLVVQPPSTIGMERKCVEEAFSAPPKKLSKHS